MSNYKRLIAIPLLLMSCSVAVASDTPFKKGNVYSVYEHLGGTTLTVEVKDVKGKWILVNNEKACKYVNKTECWVNTDVFWYASEAE
ncbi:MAG: hypothetical protein HFP76_01370 [Methylococcales symbiont of Iophon sp. n. MRB-2018]|nr:MAG: hypothetical protein HFP76_01370 [Methylococcales symbiont of Iophon sp. n. MRB-2018]SMN11355.1 hypothetical protein SPBRAN_1611 [uncultured Candidatus Thioglobus sp.]